jgi:hypothetical protein
LIPSSQKAAAEQSAAVFFMDILLLAMELLLKILNFLARLSLFVSLFNEQI